MNSSLFSASRFCSGDIIKIFRGENFPANLGLQPSCSDIMEVIPKDQYLLALFFFKLIEMRLNFMFSWRKTFFKASEVIKKESWICDHSRLVGNMDEPVDLSRISGFSKK